MLSQEEIDACVVFANVLEPFDRWTTYYQRRVSGERIEYSTDGLRRQLKRDCYAHRLSEDVHERRLFVGERHAETK